MPAKIPYSVSFVVPALNEERVLEGVIRSVSQTVDARIASYEIILIDDGSTDRTGAIMERLAAELPNMRVIHNDPNMGLGASYQRGVKEARLEYVMMLCGDGGVPASSLPPIIEKIGSADIVVPYMVNLRAIKTPTRYAISRCYTGLLNLMSGQHLNYYNGLPVHRRSLLRQINMTSSGFGFQGEILVKLLKSGCSYVEVGVEGAEATNKSSVFRVKNLASVTKTLLKLLRELAGFRAVKLGAGGPAEVVQKR
jgi:glycosyltransferase involved in cell wall biosynthesis